MSRLANHRQAVSPREKSLRAAVAASLSMTATFVVALSILNLAFMWIAPAHADSWRLFCASAMLWASALPSYLYALREEKKIPFVPAMTIAYFFYYGLPVFNDTILVKGLPYENPAVTEATQYALLGEILMLAAFYTPLGAPLDRLPKFRLRLKLRRLRWWLLAGSAVFLAITVQALYGGMPTAIAAILAAAGRIPLLLLGGIFLLYLRDRSVTGEQMIIGVTLFAIYMLIALGRGTLAQLMVAMVGFIFIYVAERGKPPVKAIVLSALLVVPFLATKIEFRSRTWGREDLGIGDRVAIFLDITYERATEGGLGFVDDALDRSRERTSYLGTLSYVVNTTPSRVPYWGGETYKHLAWTFIPRFLAPDKPARTFGQDFGHRYRLIGRQDYETSFNFAQLVEMYANYGRWGIMVGMSIIGLVYRAVYVIFNHREGGDGPLLIGAGIFAGLMNIESDASVFAGVPLSFVVFAGTLWLLNLMAHGRLSAD